MEGRQCQNNAPRPAEPADIGHLDGDCRLRKLHWRRTLTFVAEISKANTKHRMDVRGRPSIIFKEAARADGQRVGPWSVLSRRDPLSRSRGGPFRRRPKQD